MIDNVLWYVVTFLHAICLITAGNGWNRKALTNSGLDVYRWSMIDSEWAVTRVSLLISWCKSLISITCFILVWHNLSSFISILKSPIKYISSFESTDFSIYLGNISDQSAVDEDGWHTEKIKNDLAFLIFTSIQIDSISDDSRSSLLT